MKFSFHLKAKEFFVHKYYGNDIEVISTRNQELKIDAAKIIRKRGLGSLMWYCLLMILKKILLILIIEE